MFFVPSSNSKPYAFKHSARILVLNASINALTVGWSTKVNARLLAVGPRIHVARKNSGPLSTWIADGLRWGLDNRLGTAIRLIKWNEPRTYFVIALRVCWSIILSAPMLRPSCNWSSIKLIHHVFISASCLDRFVACDDRLAFTKYFAA